MTLTPDDLMAWIGEGGGVLAFLFLRVSGAMLGLPAFGDQAIPARLRLALALMFALALLPARLEAQARLPDTTLALLASGAAEIVIGLALGAAVHLLVLALRMAGTAAAQAISLSQLFGGTAGEPQTVISTLLHVGGAALAVAMGAHLRFLEAMLLSYEMFPPGQVPAVGDLMMWILPLTERATGLAFSLAAPFLVASVLYNIALGAINKAMPQLMVAMIGAPAITLLGIALLAIVTPIALSLWWRAIETFLGTWGLR